MLIKLTKIVALGINPFVGGVAVVNQNNAAPATVPYYVRSEDIIAIAGKPGGVGSIIQVMKFTGAASIVNVTEDPEDIVKTIEAIEKKENI